MVKQFHGLVAQMLRHGLPRFWPLCYGAAMPNKRFNADKAPG